MDELHSDDPRRIGPYWLEKRLGAGGMGCVYLGRSTGGHYVAIKAIRTELADDPSFRTRFAREVAAAQKVNGIFTAPLVDADLNGPVPWLATTYIPGPSLADAVAHGGPLPATSILALAAGLAEGLQAIHSAGIVHRDLKPSNVIPAEDGPRLIDFGISQSAGMSTLTEHLGGVRPAVGLHVADHHVGAPPGSPARLGEHGVGLSHPGRGAQVDAQLPANRHRFLQSGRTRPGREPEPDPGADCRLPGAGCRPAHQRPAFSQARTRLGPWHGSCRGSRPGRLRCLPVRRSAMPALGVRKTTDIMTLRYSRSA